MADNGTGDWITEFFQDADSLQIDRLSTWFADDIEVHFGNQPAIKGKEGAKQAFEGFWSSISGMGHERVDRVQNGDMAVQMATVTYTRHDGSKVSLPVASHLRLAGPHSIDRLWIYIDLAPLFAEAA